MRGVFLVPVCALALWGCTDEVTPTDVDTRNLTASATSAPAPSPLTTVEFGGRTLRFWPFTASNLSGTPEDPVNLVFTGQTDPRALRAALLSLDGDRSAFGLPNASPFNCTWEDAIGGVQATYSEAGGWAGSAVQLACGPYGPLRFHLRFFAAGDWTLGGAHFEVLIPGTTEHQVLSWELAEQLVVVDFLRSGLLDAAAPLAPTGQINPAPFREIPAVIYNGLPVELRAAIGGPLSDVAGPVPIGTDGRATIVNVAGTVEASPGITRQEFVINFDQVIPKPFCASGPFDFIYVQGPVRLSQQVVVTTSGNFISRFHALGRLDVTPVNPLTTPPTPIGETYRAIVDEQHRGIVTDRVTLASSFQLQIELPPQGPFRGRLVARLQVGPRGVAVSDLSAECTP